MPPASRSPADRRRPAPDRPCRGEGVIERALRCLRLGQNFDQPDAVIAAVAEQPRGGVDQAGAGGGRRSMASERQHDLADMGRAFHPRMGLAGAVQRKSRIHHRREPARRDPGPDLRPRAASRIARLGRSAIAGAGSSPRCVCRRIISGAKFTSAFGPCRKAMICNRPRRRQRREVARQVVAGRPCRGSRRRRPRPCSTATKSSSR